MYAVVVKKRCLITDYHRFIAEHSDCSSSWVVWLQWWFFVQRSVSIKVRIRLMWTQHTAGVVSHFNGCSTDIRERETLLNWSKSVIFDHFWRFSDGLGFICEDSALIEHWCCDSHVNEQDACVWVCNAEVLY